MDIQNDIYLLKSGDVLAFERIFRQYSRSMFFVAMGLVDDRQVAEDAVQESFVYLWNHRHQIEPARNLPCYLKQSVRNYIFNYFRHNRIQKKHAEALVREQKFWAESANDDYAEKLEHVREFLLSLPEQCRNIFVLAVVEGMGYAETASSLHVSVNTVKSQVKIAYRKLKSYRGMMGDEAFSVYIFIFLKYFS